MEQKGPLNIYEAVERMREISASGGTFALKFRKWDRQRHHGGDVAVLKLARLRRKASDERIENSSHKVFLTDTATGRALVCWMCLIVEFNGRRVSF